MCRAIESRKKGPLRRRSGNSGERWGGATVIFLFYLLKGATFSPGDFGPGTWVSQLLRYRGCDDLPQLKICLSHLESTRAKLLFYKRF